jgi:hypothetical protein
VKLAGLAHHFIDLGDVLLLESDLFPGVFFKPHVLVYYEREQVVVLPLPLGRFPGAAVASG